MGEGPGRKKTEVNRAAKDPAREAAFRILLSYERGEGFLSDLTKKELEECKGLKPEDRAFIRRLTALTVSGRIRLDAVLGRISSTPVRKMKPTIRVILRMGLSQILFMDSVPGFAAANESVSLAAGHGFGALTGFVNAVLRRAVREKDEIIAFLQTTDDLSVRFSLPPFIFSLWMSQYGAGAAEAAARAADREPVITFRLRRGGEALFPDALKGRYLDYARRVSSPGDIRLLPGYAEGLFIVQDESSMLVAEAAGIHGGEKILDICAAPGGKSLHLADKLAEACGGKRETEGGREGNVLALDLTAEKVRRIRENAKRLGTEALVTAEVSDATVYRADLEGRFDVVICDLPCSGLGVLAKKPDIRDHVSAESIAELAALQRTILRNAVCYVRPGGVLIYSTCTVNRQENDENAGFLRKELGMEPEPLAPYLPQPLREEMEKDGRGEDFSLQLFPDEGGTDGFFISRFRRKAYCGGQPSGS